LSFGREFRKYLAIPLTERLPSGEEGSDSTIHERGASHLRDVAAIVPDVFRVVGEFGIGGRPNVARGEVGEQRIFSGSAVAVTFVTPSLPAEDRNPAAPAAQTGPFQRVRRRTARKMR
jgi:hypothetical protein